MEQTTNAQTTKAQATKTANETLHGKYGRYFKTSTGAAVVIHALVIIFFVAPGSPVFTKPIDEFEVLDLPPEIKIPPPPEEIARPATPVISEEPVSEEITIAETDIIEDQEVPDAPPPPPVVEEVVGNQFTFTPYTVKPKCEEGCTADDILRHLPPLLKRSGISCSLTVGIKIDTSGKVTTIDLLKSSGNPSCDKAAETWARATKWTTAFNRDQPVVVWIAQPVTITTN